LVAYSPEQRLDLGKDKRGRGERRKQCQAGQLLAAWEPHELAFDEIELVLNRGEVGAGLVG
jgi:hypothetical protein